MRDYELVIILSSKLDKKKQEQIIAKLKKTLTSLKGKITKEEKWGQKNFAFPIKKQLQGSFHIFNFFLNEEKLIDFKKKILIEEGILRYLLIRLEKRRG